MIIQKQILNRSKFIPPGYTFSKDLVCKIILQALRERSCSVKGAEQWSIVYRYKCCATFKVRGYGSPKILIVQTLF